MTPVEKENIIKGYQYGKQIVPIDSIMEEKMKYKCERNFSLLGFVEKAAVPRHFFMSSVDMVVPVDSEKSRK
jgi:ATP-dependent DNA helicase 2 subunit 2